MYWSLTRYKHFINLSRKTQTKIKYANQTYINISTSTFVQSRFFFPPSNPFVNNIVFSFARSKRIIAFILTKSFRTYYGLVAPKTARNFILFDFGWRFIRGKKNSFTVNSVQTNCPITLDCAHNINYSSYILLLIRRVYPGNNSNMFPFVF